MSTASRAFSRLRGLGHVVLDRARGLTTRTCSPLLAELLRAAPSSCAVLEGLEPRLLLAGSSLASVLAVYTGELTAPGEQDVIALDLAAGNFAPTRTEATMFGFCLEAVVGSPLDAAVVKASFAGGQSVQARYVEPDLPGAADSLALYELPYLHTQYDLLVEGDGGTSGGYVLSVFLVGDVDGDHDVDTDDTTEMRVCYGALAPNAPYRAEADANLDGRITSFDMTQHRRNIGARGHLDHDGPVIHASLANDTGVLADDGETYDATVTGTISDASTIVSFLAGLDAAPTVEIIGELAGGSFTLTPAEMASIFGSPIGDGPHTLNLQAEDEHANASAVLPLAFTLDTAAPAEPLFDLDPASDSPPVGDGETTEERVTLAGQTDANTFVELVQTGATTASDGAGAFAFADVPLALGTNSFTVTATDAAGNVSLHDRPITRLAANTPPTFTSDPVTWAQEGAPYVYDITATDEDDPLTSLCITATQELPGWLVLTDDGDGTGALVGVPGPADVGAANDVRLAVSDGRGGMGTQEFAITVEPAPQPDFVDPVVTLSVGPNPVSVDDMVTIDLCATDDTGVTDVLLTVAGTPVPVVADPCGQVTMAFGSPGVIEVAVEARDAAGNVGWAVDEVLVVALGDSTPPTVALTSPADDTAINAITPVTGTASDDQQLLYYTLSVASVSGGEYVEIHRGESAVSSGLLGSIDPTGLGNDTYRLRLTAVDAGGNSAWVERVVSVTGNQKVGDFRLSFVDLTLPASGIPLTVTRVYDSTTADQSGDFGYGWSLDVKSNIRLRVNRVQGVGWQQVKSGWIIPTYTLLPTVDHTVSIYLPNGRTEVFDLKPVPNSSTLVPVQDTTAAYAPRPGTRGSLVPLGARDLWVVAGGGSSYELLDWGSLMPYDPDRFEYTASDGTKYVISETSGVQRITDRNGNEVTIDSGGIIASAGLAVTFARDAENRITRITDPAGNAIQYDYDDRGNLASVTDREGNVTRFNYYAFIPHHLETVIDPLGRTGARMEYDEQGRLSRVIHPDGSFTTLTHDTDNNLETVTDPNGDSTYYEYDSNGNVTREWDAYGNETVRTYDAGNNLLAETDPLGNTKTYTYDNTGNLTSWTDPLGNMTTYTYSLRGDLLTTADPLGHVTANTYDANGNLTSTTDALGNAVTHTYFPGGNRESTTDACGSTTTFEYDGNGRLTKEIDPLGNETTYTYDSLGNRLTAVDPLGNTTANSYDADGRVVSMTDPLGHTRTTEYDATGKLAAHVDALGRRTEYQYSFGGSLLGVNFADGTDTYFVYDALDRTIMVEDRGGRQTHYKYLSLAHGLWIDTILPDQTPDDLADNPWTRREYDLAGCLVAEVDELGNRTEYEYDGAGRRIGVIDPLGNHTRYEYDDAGNLTAGIDPLGNGIQYEYDGVGRLIRTTFADASQEATAYDEAGNTISETDRNGNTTTYEYDPLSRRIALVDALGHRTEYDYDVVGNLVQQRDANGNITSYEYDVAGNREAVVLPMGQRATWQHDAAGNVTSSTDFAGTTVTYEYDANGRVTAKRYPNASSAEYAYTATGLPEAVTDGRGVTAYDYDVRGRLLSRTEPDGRIIEYTYDDAGNALSVETPSGVTAYTYDPLNRMVSVVDAEGGATTYEYDAVGNLGRTSLPNGTVETRTYDSLNRLTQAATTGPGGTIASFTYDLDAVGNRIAVAEHGGRNVVYTYDALNRLMQEAITDPVHGARTVQYTYDPVGNRIVRIDSVVGTTSYAYDANDRLLTETAGPAVTTYTYDDNGNTLTEFTDADNQATYVWDYDGRLVEAEKVVAGSAELVQYRYNAAGLRVARIDAGGETRYLLDTNRRYPQVVEEYTPGGAPEAVYVHGLDLISQSRGGNRSFYHADALGSTRVLSDAAGDATDRYVYNAYGELLHQTGSTMNSHLFAGEHRDKVTGLDFLRTRYMDPRLGRFLSADSMRELIEQPILLHPYVYANNNPVRLVDPTGQFFTIAGVFSVSITISHIQTAYASALLTALNKVRKIADSILLIGYKMQEIGLAMVIRNMDHGLEFYDAGRHLLAEGYQQIYSALVQVYPDTLKNLISLEIKITKLVAALRWGNRIITLDLKRLIDIYQGAKGFVGEVEKVLKALEDKPWQDVRSMTDYALRIADGLLKKL